jgi:hypothetical protein
MGRKPLEKEKIDQIILLSATGEQVKTIMDATGLSRPTILNYQKQLENEIDEKREELGRDMETVPGGYQKPPKEMEEPPVKKTEKKMKLPSVEEETAKKTISKASNSVSELKARELTEDYKAAQMLHSASVRYRSNIEMMGLEWERFIAFAIDQAYAQAVTAYEEKVEERLREAELMENEMNEKLENPEGNMESVVEEEVEE